MKATGVVRRIDKRRRSTGDNIGTFKKPNTSLEFGGL